MIIRKIGLRNFKSYGNKKTEIVLDSHPLTVVRGKNGSGKTSIMDALYFALYGTGRKGEPPSLMVNDISGRDMEVALEFERAGVGYLLKRTEKGAELFADGERISLPSDSRERQKAIESFTGMPKAGLRPGFVDSRIFEKNFVNMRKSERRELMESLLEGGLFERMEKIVSDERNETKLKLKEIEGKISGCEYGKKRFQRHEGVSPKEKTERLSKELAETKRRVSEMEKSIPKRSENVEALLRLKNERELLSKRLGELEKRRDAVDVRIWKNEEEKRRYEEAKEEEKTVLLARKREVVENFLAEEPVKESEKNARELEKLVYEIKGKISETEGKLSALERERDTFVAKYKACSGCPKLALITDGREKKLPAEIDSAKRALKELGKKLSDTEKLLAETVKKTEKLIEAERRGKSILETIALEEEILEILTKLSKMPIVNDKDVAEAERRAVLQREIEKAKEKKVFLEEKLKEVKRDLSELEKLEKTLVELTKEKTELSSREKACEAILKVLRSPSSRMALLRSYVPFLSKRIDDYLATFGSIFKIRLDFEGNATILKRYEKIDSKTLSRGESLKINLAVTMAFTELYEKRTGASTNVLFFDEIDGVLDTESFHVFLEMLTKLKKNSYVITHRSDWEDFGALEGCRVMEITKTRFTRVEERA